MILSKTRGAEVAIRVLNAEIKDNLMSESPLLPPPMTLYFHVIPNEVRNLRQVLK